jgi:hypothetical protein
MVNSQNIGGGQELHNPTEHPSREVKNLQELTNNYNKWEDGE